MNHQAALTSLTVFIAFTRTMQSHLFGDSLFVEQKQRSYRLCLKSSLFCALSRTKRRARAARCHDLVMTITGRLWLISFHTSSSSNSTLFDKIIISENKSSKSDKLNIDMANSQAQKIDVIKNISLTVKIIITFVLSFTSRDCVNYRKAVCEKVSHCRSMYLFSPPAFENKLIDNKLSSKLSNYFILPSRLTINCLCKFTRKHNELIGQTILMDSC